MTDINFFKDINKNMVSLAGGKGASLGEMYNSGFSVPFGFVILSSAFEKHLKNNNLDKKITEILKKTKTNEKIIETASKDIQKLIIDSCFSKDLEKEVITAFKQLETSFVAIRSSATAEDSIKDAWAGQLDTFLYIPEKEIIGYVKKCWASLFTQRAIFYRIEKGLLDKKISVAVVVQKMVNSEKSGIAFSVNPVTNNDQEIIIDAGYGLGEAIVSGQVTPDNYVVNKDLVIIGKTKGTQEKGLFRKDNDSGTIWKDLSLENKNNFVLSDKIIKDLSKIIIDLEKHYGFPVDVEWAIEDNKIFITQSRPVTTFNNVNNNSKKLIEPVIKEKYNRLARYPNMPYLITEIAMEGYKNLNPLFINLDNFLTFYLSEKSIKKANNYLLKKFNTNDFEKYLNELQNKVNLIEKKIIHLISKEKVTKSLVKKCINYIINLEKIYSLTEHYYTDKAYTLSKSNKLIKNNLKLFGEFKNEVRLKVNKVVLSDHSYLLQLLFKISNFYNVDVNQLLFSSIDEIYLLFDNKNINLDKIKKRIESYLITNNLKIEGEKVYENLNKFNLNNDNNKNNNIIKGTPVNFGKSQGVVKKYVETIGNYEKNIDDFILSFNSGEILVAETTVPNLLPAIKKAKGIITAEGGLLSHAAIISREFNIPCIVGIGNDIDKFENENFVEIDANNGLIKILFKKKMFKNK